MKKYINYIVTKSIAGGWIVCTQRENVSATVWDKPKGSPYFDTAKAARAHVEDLHGDGLTPWSKHIGRGNAYYTAQTYTGLIRDGVGLYNANKGE